MVTPAIPRLPVEIISQPAPGRVRLKVLALYRQDDFKHQLEQAILALGYVESVKANALTGSIVVLFDPLNGGTAGLYRDLEPILGPIGLAQTAPAKTDKPRQSRLFRRPRSQAHETSRVRPKARAGQPVESAPQPASIWHAQTAVETLSLLESLDQGLTQAMALSRLERFGPNVLEE
ncbi:MAG: hypothetical protein EHM62_05455, partial [Methylococcus sp.]